MAKSKLVKNVYLQPLVQMRIVVKNLPANNSGHVRDTGLIPGSRRAPGGRHGNPLVSLPAESPGQSSLAGYSLWGHKELDMAENMHTGAIIHSSTDNSRDL